MADVLANLLIKLGVDDSELSKLDQGLSSRLSGVGQSMSQTGRKLTTGLTLPIGLAGAGLFQLAEEAETAQARLSSSFDSMGASAFTSMDKLGAHAEALQAATTFDDEAITNYQSVLLTFGNVTGDVFSQATELGLDMSAKLGTDLQSTAIQVGKALNDPVKGVTALTRVGVSFTQQQKDQIAEMQASGDMAGAQAVILQELQRQFGGTAEAMAQTNTGQAKQAMNALANAGESIAVTVAPMFAKLAGWAKTLAERFQSLSPEMKEWIIRIAAVVAAVGPVLFVGGKLISTFGQVGKAFGILSKVVSANPWVVIIAATVALVTLIVTNWDTIVGFLKKVWATIKGVAETVWGAIKGFFKGAVDFIKNLFLNFTPLGLIISNFDKIKDAASSVKDWISDRIDDVVGFFKGLPGRISSAVSGMWDGIKNAFKDAVNWLIDKWNDFHIPAVKIAGVQVSPRIDFPNIPKLHEGGVYHAPTPGGEGLALLRDQEVVSEPGGGGVNVYVQSQADPLAIGSAVAWRMRTQGV